MNISINTYRRKIGNHGVIHPSYDQAIVQYIDHGLYRLKRHKVVCACIIQQKGKKKNTYALQHFSDFEIARFLKL